MTKIKRLPRGGDYSSFWRECAMLLASRPRDEFINQLLKTLGSMHRADRAWLMVYDRECLHFWNSHEWVRRGITPFVDALQGTPVAMMDWLHRQLLEGDIVQIANTARLPRQASALRAEMLRQGNKSSLCVPVFYQRRLCGQFGYDSVRRYETWSERELELLRDVGDLLGEILNAPADEAAMPLPSARVSSGQHVYSRTRNGFAAVDVDEIVVIRAMRDYSRITYARRAPTIELRSLKSWLGMLPADKFLQVQRGTIVHTGWIERLERSASTGWRLHLLGLDEPVGVGRAFRHALRQKMGF